MLDSVYHQRGLSLIEALIALLVLSIGLVGLGALMLISMQNVHSSAHYSVASAITLDFEELLWKEISQTAAGTSAKNVTDLDSNGCLSNSDISALATAVTNEWGTASAGGNGAWTDAERFKIPGLSLSVGEISVDPAPTRDDNGDGVNDVNVKRVPITLTWNEGRFSDENDQETYTAEIRIPCRPTFL